MISEKLKIVSEVLALTELPETAKKLARIAKEVEDLEKGECLIHWREIDPSTFDRDSLAYPVLCESEDGTRVHGFIYKVADSITREISFVCSDSERRIYPVKYLYIPSDYAK